MEDLMLSELFKELDKEVRDICDIKCQFAVIRYNQKSYKEKLEMIINATYQYEEIFQWIRDRVAVELADLEVSAHG